MTPYSSSPATDLSQAVSGSYMSRCIELARRGAGFVAPNPMVGAVLVHDGIIIGEGYHEVYGQAHAEVNCIRQAIDRGHADKLTRSAMYVSLEPCAHFGKTPPCADLIIEKKIPKVVIGCRDPFTEVNGKGIEKLRAAGVEVVTGVLEQECLDLNRRFFSFHTLHRPYIILKWAQSQDGKIAAKGENRQLISNDYSNRLVHRWRAEEAAILVGTNTALLDDPALTTRLWPGRSPLRAVVDRDLRLPHMLRVFDGSVPTIIFNNIKQEEGANPIYWKIKAGSSLVQELMSAFFQLGILSVLVEGGARLLESFIDEECWDEARIITNRQLTIGEGLSAPLLKNAIALENSSLSGDAIHYFKHITP